MEDEIRKIVVRALVGFAVAGVFFWQWRARQRRKSLSLRPRDKR